jgi:hypothetical protein
VQTHHHLLTLLLSWGLGYLRWTQLVPMLLVWSLGVVMVLALTFINFQTQAVPALVKLLEWLVRLPLIGERIALWLAGDGDGLRVKSTDFEFFVVSGWAVVSLLFMLAGLLLSAWLGPFRPWTLKRKLAVAAAAAVVLLGGMLLNYYLVPDNFNGTALDWTLNFSLICLLVFAVSAYSLSVAHFLGYLNASLLAAESSIPTRATWQRESRSGYNSPPYRK